MKNDNIIGANALITKNIEENSVYVGSSGKKIQDVKDNELGGKKKGEH